MIYDDRFIAFVHAHKLCAEIWTLCTLAEKKQFSERTTTEKKKRFDVYKRIDKYSSIYSICDCYSRSVRHERTKLNQAQAQNEWERKKWYIIHAKFNWSIIYVRPTVVFNINNASSVLWMLALFLAKFIRSRSIYVSRCVFSPATLSLGAGVLN